MNYEKEREFEEKYPNFYSLLNEISYYLEEGKSEWDAVREIIVACEDAQKLLGEIEEFLRNNPADFEHVVGDVSNCYFDDTNEFLRWVEQLKAYVTSVKRKLCGK